MLRNLTLFVCGISLMGAVAAQSQQFEQVVIYKWKSGHLTHYAKQPPRGVAGVIKLDKDGQIIHDESEDDALFEAMRPMRPAQNTTEHNTQQNNQTNHNTAKSAQEKSLPEGAITREQRCQQAQKDIEVLRNAPADKPVNLEDSEGNLVPMTDAQKNERMAQAQALVDRLCQ